MRVRWFLAVAVLVSAFTAARAGPDGDSLRGSRTRARVVVELTASGATLPWLARAFQHSITRELSGFERVTAVEPAEISGASCGADRSCRLRVYNEAHVDIALFGLVTDGEIRYELYQTWTPARLASGAIPVRDQTAIGLKQEVRAAFHPVLKHGGVLDQRPYMYEAERDAASGWLSFPRLLVLGALGALALPFVVVAVWLRSGRALLALRSARWAAAVAIGLVVAGVVGGSVDLAAVVIEWPWLFAGAGGLAWGALIIAAGRTMFPRLTGLARAAHDDIGRILWIWCVMAVQRLAVVIIIYTPFALLAIWVAARLAMPDRWMLGLIAPALLWLARWWLAAWVDCIAVVHDHRLVDGPATIANPWSQEIADYVMGYVRRTGWDIDLRLLSRVVFLPGKRVGGVVTYGGGTTHARIVVDRGLLELAMGELVEVKPAEKPALWPDWTMGTIVARPPGSVVRSRGPATVATYRGRKPRAAAHAMIRKALGQAATLLGYVVPAPGERVPLISDNPQDLKVVRALLLEHYPWDAPDPDDEFDVTDPTDQDLLFGALVRELGVVERQDGRLQTVKLVFGQRVAGMMSRTAARIADVYPALNFAGHHFVQYLYYMWTRDPVFSTARAHIARLQDTSLQIMDRVRQPPPIVRPPPSRFAVFAKGAAALRRRLIWLSWFFPDPIVDRRETWLRRAGTAAVVAVALAAAGVLVKRSIDYHATYTARIAAQEQARAEALLKQSAERKQPEGPVDGKAQKVQ